MFIDLGGVDGLVHITDLILGKSQSPRRNVELDRETKVVILDFDDDKKRIALGCKTITTSSMGSLAKLKLVIKSKGKL